MSMCHWVIDMHKSTFQNHLMRTTIPDGNDTYINLSNLSLSLYINDVNARKSTGLSLKTDLFSLLIGEIDMCGELLMIVSRIEECRNFIMEPVSHLLSHIAEISSASMFLIHPLTITIVTAVRGRVQINADISILMRMLIMVPICIYIDEYCIVKC